MVLAEKLTGNLLPEIVVRGSRGGLLEPLAATICPSATASTASWSRCAAC
jgi:hypothetical protein